MEIERVGKLNKYYMQNTVLVAETREHLQHIMSEFERTCDSMELKINVGKNKGQKGEFAKDKE